MTELNNLQASIKASFYTIKRTSPNHEIISIRLSKTLNKGIWEYLQQHNCFVEFLQNCKNDISKQLAITEQTINKVNIVIEIWDRNCDIDDMNCKHIRATFYTYEGTYKAYDFDLKILLSDFNTSAEVAVMGNILIKLIRKEEEKYYNNIAKECLKLIGIFMFSLAVSYYIEEGFKIFISTIILGVLVTILWIIIEQLSRIYKAIRKENKDTDFTITI